MLDAGEVLESRVFSRAAGTEMVADEVERLHRMIQFPAIDGFVLCDAIAGFVNNGERF